MQATTRAPLSSLLLPRAALRPTSLVSGLGACGAAQDARRTLITSRSEGGRGVSPGKDVPSNCRDMCLRLRALSSYHITRRGNGRKKGRERQKNVKKIHSETLMTRVPSFFCVSVWLAYHVGRLGDQGTGSDRHRVQGVWNSVKTYEGLRPRVWAWGRQQPSLPPPRHPLRPTH